MAAADYEIKQGRHLAVKGKGQKRFIRFSSLPKGYREADIRAYFLGEVSHGFNPRCSVLNQKPMGLLLDIEKIQKEKAGYVTWATIYNLKQLAKSRLYLVDHKINSLRELHSVASEKSSKSDAMLSSIRNAEAKLTEIAILKKHINYSKTRETYEAYRKAGYSKRFFEAHREEITLHKAAKQAFDELGVKKIPKVKDLNQQYAEILTTKKQAYAEYRKIRDESRESRSWTRTSPPSSMLWKRENGNAAEKKNSLNESESDIEFSSVPGSDLFISGEFIAAVFSVSQKRVAHTQCDP